MFEHHLPRHKVGVLLPLSIIDNAAYEFYRLAPPGIMQVMIPIGLAEFSSADVERALFKPLASNLDKLMERGIDLVVQSGTPLPILIGIEAPIQDIVVGIVLVLAVTLDTIVRRRAAT